VRASDRFWYRIRPAHLVLIPLSLVFRGVVRVRAELYRRGALQVARLPVPVIVVGNITVGGTGKTPLVLWLADWLRAHGWRPGIVSRGYGGSGEVQAVTPQSDAAQAGDEPLLLARRSGVPVCTGRQRTAAAHALLVRHPECNVIVSDDGLQHYRLARDVEIAVVDGERRFGNGWLLPAGPLREPVSRLDRVDAVVVNGAGFLGRLRTPQYAMRLEGATFRNLRDPQASAGPERFRGTTVHAVAGIGHPQRFFEHLRTLGLTVRPHPFPDHYAFAAEDLAFAGGDTVLMTEKDAVKCLAFARENYWYLQVEADVDPQLAHRVLDRIKSAHGSQAA
jgi:tetraacyldisaccharide 4'-kinase